MGVERGQAQIEAVACLVLLAFVAGLGVKAAAVIDSVLIADGAAHAGALAAAAGGDGEAAARRALPGRRRAEARVRSHQGTVSVRLPVGLGERSRSRLLSRAWSRVPGG